MIVVRRSLNGDIAGVENNWTMPEIKNFKPVKNQPDRLMASEILSAKFPYNKVKEFKRLSEIRNGLPLVHGKRDASGNALKSVNATEEDIDSLVNVLGSLVDKHKELLNRHKR